jgi:hypothetical protein
VTRPTIEDCMSIDVLLASQRSAARWTMLRSLFELLAYASLSLSRPTAGDALANLPTDASGRWRVDRATDQP